MLVNLKNILRKARKGKYAVGAFNTSNLEITQAIIRAAEKLRSPVIIATSEKAIRYAGIEVMSNMIITLAKSSSIPVVLHLDHGRTYEICRECIQHGYSSVMIDASCVPYRENLKLTRKVVKYAHLHRVSVEAELGRLAGIEDGITVKPAEALLYTNPDEAKCFADTSGCDALAIAIGTSHGAHKYKGKPKLRIDILRSIARRVTIPLVLHGASGVKKKWINQVNKYGGTLQQTKGVPDGLLQKAIMHGITKINTDTDLRIAFTAGVREHLAINQKDFDPRRLIGAGRDLIQRVVEARIVAFGSRNKA